MAKKGILERLKEGVVLGDGGYLLELEKRGWVRPGPFTPEVAITHPEALRELHVEFREAGFLGQGDRQESGSHGFGYDPIFCYPPYGKTFGEVSGERKAAVSHRGEAIRALRSHLEQNL